MTNDQYLLTNETIAMLLISLICLSVTATEPPESNTTGLPVASPQSVGMDADHLGRMDGLVEEQIRARNIPGCVVMIIRQGKQVLLRAYGHRQLQPEPLSMTPDTVFDMASITKPVATATSIMLLVERGQIRLDDKFGIHADAFHQNGKEDVTIFQMLTHQAGFVPDSPLVDYTDRDQIWPKLWALRLDYRPGTRFVYSDVGYQMLGKLVELTSGQSLHEFSRENIFAPLGMTETGFLPGEALRERAATTEQREGRWMKGEVHDPRSYAMGGVAGHAGLFSTARDLSRYAQMILQHGSLDGIRVLSSRTVDRMLESHPVGRFQRALGWDVRSRYSTNRGELMSDRAIGHGGFTGTAMWIDPELDLAVIFLSNRVHPDGTGSANRLAGRIATLAVASIREDDQKKEAAADANARGPGEVFPGIDVLASNDFQTLAGRRVGLITNHTGVDRHGDRTIDLLRSAKNVELVAIFSPEHGIVGVRDDPNIGDAVDETTQLRITSLYGENRVPTEESLETIDTLVFDIQDIGTRFYTYISTMGNAMRAASLHDKRFVVLDRPNPLGGLVVAGPVLDAGSESFVGFHPIPVQHGMTVGELATMIRDERGWNLDLAVVPVEGWQRAMLWDETGLVWINPSPNMRSLTEAQLYPGIGLLETTNLSVGRGTDRPFEVIGAPWINAREFAAALNRRKMPGLRFVPRFFTPSSSKFAGEVCGGVDIVVTERDKLHVVDAGLDIALTLRRLYHEEWEYKRMARLLCDEATLHAIGEGQPFESIRKRVADETSAFKKRRAKYLIYD